MSLDKLVAFNNLLDEFRTQACGRHMGLGSKEAELYARARVVAAYNELLKGGQK